MSKVLPLTRWKDKSLAEREEFSDEEDSEDEDNEVEEFTIPLKSRKRKISSGGKKKATVADSKKICAQATCARASRSTSGPTSEATRKRRK